MPLTWCPSILAIPLLFDVCEYHTYHHPGLKGGVSLQVSPHAAHCPSCQSLVPSPHLIPPPSYPPAPALSQTFWLQGTWTDYPCTSLPTPPSSSP